MIRALILTALLATATGATAQDLPELPDVNLIREDTRLDLTWVPPLTVQQAIAASEDVNWFDSFPATSTITQQVVKNYLLSSERSLLRKAMEVRLAIDMANAYSAEEIISIYAQLIYLGRNCSGFAAALDHRLGVSIEDATLRDALTLAAFIKSPIRYEDEALRTQRYRSLVVFGQEAGFWDLATRTRLQDMGPTPVIAGASCPIR